MYNITSILYYYLSLSSNIYSHTRNNNNNIISLSSNIYDIESHYATLNYLQNIYIDNNTLFEISDISAIHNVNFVLQGRINTLSSRITLIHI